MIKAYTDLEQSKRLAEFLPLDSADMVYIATDYDDNGEPLYTADYKSEYIWEDNDVIHCWSLATLLEIINKCCRYGVRLKFLRSTFDGFGNVLKNVWCITTDTSETEPFVDVVYADNALDAAVNVVLKLHEQKLI